MRVTSLSRFSTSYFSGSALISMPGFSSRIFTALHFLFQSRRSIIRFHSGALCLAVLNALVYGCSFHIWSTYHLQFNLDAEGLLFNSGHTSGEGLSHACGPAQGQLWSALKPSNRAWQNCGTPWTPHKQAADILPAERRTRVYREWAGSFNTSTSVICNI